MTRIIQRGLFSNNKEKVEAFGDRVSEYNKEKGLLAVELEAREDENGRWELVLHFASRGYARDFWTDPKYETRIIQ